MAIGVIRDSYNHKEAISLILDQIQIDQLTLKL